MAQAQLPLLNIRPLSFKLQRHRPSQSISAEELTPEEKLDLLSSRRERKTPRPCSMPFLTSARSGCRSVQSLTSLSESLIVDVIGPRPVDILEKIARSGTPHKEDIFTKCGDNANGDKGLETDRSGMEDVRIIGGRLNFSKTGRQSPSQQQEALTAQKTLNTTERRRACSAKSFQGATPSSIKPAPPMRGRPTSRCRRARAPEMTRISLSLPRRRSPPVQRHHPSYMAAAAAAASRTRSLSQLRIGGATFPRSLPQRAVIDGASGAMRFSRSLTNVVRQLAKYPRSWDEQSDTTATTTCTTSSGDATSASTDSDSLAARAVANAGGLGVSPLFRKSLSNTSGHKLKTRVAFSTLDRSPCASSEELDVVGVGAVRMHQTRLAHANLQLLIQPNRAPLYPST